MTLTRLLLTSLAVISGASGAVPVGENLVLDPFGGDWKVGYRQSNATTAIVEFVSGRETVENWTQLATLLSQGDQKNADLDRYFQRMADGLGQRCVKGARFAVREKAKRDGLPARVVSVECAAYRSGKPESYMLLAVAGHEGLYSLQIAKKAPRLDRATMARWTAFVKKLHICDTRDPSRPCSADQVIDAR